MPRFVHSSATPFNPIPPKPSSTGPVLAASSIFDFCEAHDAFDAQRWRNQPQLLGNDGRAPSSAANSLRPSEIIATKLAPHPGGPRSEKLKDTVPTTYSELHGRLALITPNEKTLTSMYSRVELAMVLRRHSIPANRNKPDLVLELMRLIKAGSAFTCSL